jgi:cephalosporin-C deacetylase-like acetyl esterase/lysophospholipase L1-like esterase
MIREMLRSKLSCLLSLLACAFPVFPAEKSAPAAASPLPITLTPYKPSGIYALGEPVGWKIAVRPGAQAHADYTFTAKKNNLEIIKTGHLNLGDGHAAIELSLSEPAMVYVEVSRSAASEGDNNKETPLVVGAAVAPEKLQPAVPAPADFESFWRSKIKLLRAIPANPVLMRGTSDKPGVEYATITMDHINGKHVHGQLAKPAHAGKFPGLVIFQWASPPYPLQKAWVTDRAAEGWLALNIEPHDVLPDQPASYYEALPPELKKYQTIGRNDRDKSYFLQMYLADYRAIEYLASRPDWDGRTLVVMGTSMGGQQSLCAAGLHPRVTALVVNEPAGADSNGPLHGRASGYPNWPVDDPQVMRTALYFDTVNCAMHIKVPSLVAMGFVDTSAPPVGIWTAFNQIRAPKQAAPMIDSPHNNLATPEQQMPYTRGSAEWLGLLVQGYNPLPPGNEPSPRTDRNSLLAHEQLLRKAHTGQIDLYFLGDSITRRWGAADAQYQELLANWKQSFFGWNAADFGWGSDTTQNILWRLSHGELDGVNPKVIVLMAGTNNVGRAGPLKWNDATAADVAKGIQAILQVCRKKAPGARIVLMGVTPRNDNMEMMPVINGINARLAKLADGRRVRYLNINDRLADANGQLYDGMINPDHLHLAVQGYQVWADALKPVLTEWLGPPAPTDSAPAPTGDPSATASR